MVRIAHLADTHLGYKQYSLAEREQDIYDVLEEVSDKILEEHADIVIHSGDLFDSPRPTPQAYCAFKSFLKKIDGKAKIFAVLGDHDRPKSRGMPPHVLFDDKVQTLGISGIAEHQIMKINGKDILIAGLSNLSRTYHAILAEELKKLETMKAKCKTSVLVLHEAIEKFFPYEGASEITLDEVPKNFNYYAMGHLHARIKSSHGNGELAYPGSTEIIRKDEIAGWKKLGKGFYIVDLEDQDISIANVNLDRIRPQMEAKLGYAHMQEELEKLATNIETSEKLPIIHIRIEGKEIDRQGVHQALSEALTGKTLTFRQEIVEEAEMRLPELKPGSFYVDQVLREYFKDQNIAGLALEMLKNLKHGDINEAKNLADEYFQKAKKA
jgi:DNA repair exonuclease SbcCD nuclease subunit